MLRKIIISALGVLLLLGSFYVSKSLSASKKKPTLNKGTTKTAVYVDEVKNDIIPLKITTTGQLQAKEKVAIYSEVQGIMERGRYRFFEGTNFRKGDILLSINKDEFLASLKAQRSNLFNQIVSIMPDLKLDYPDAASAWEKYIADFDVNKSLPELPIANSDQEKFYIAGKQIYSSYYNIKNLEVRLRKHYIKAPFSGYVAQAMVKEGSLIRPGQKLGEFVSPNIFELEVPVNASFEHLVKVGKKVKTRDIEKTKEWTGVVKRLNKQINPGTQSITAYIELRGEDLFDGMFLEAELDAKEIENAYEISRKLLGGDNSVFYVQDSVLKRTYVEAVHFNQSTVIVKNLPDGIKILANALPGAYPGMKVEVLENK